MWGRARYGVDRDTVQQFTASIIQEAARIGNCVIIGRSAQCILQHHAHVLRMLVYAPLKEKLARMKVRHPEKQNLPALLRRKDSERIHYARYYYDCDSTDPRLYHITMNSTLGIDTCTRLVAQIIRLPEGCNGPRYPFRVDAIVEERETILSGGILSV